MWYRLWVRSLACALPCKITPNATEVSKKDMGKIYRYLTTVKRHDDVIKSLQWRHNEHDCVSNHQPRHCLLNRLFGRRSKKTSKLRATGLCVGNSPGTGEFPAQRASNAENVSIWWRHHVETFPCHWLFVRGNRWSPVDSPHKGQWRGALMFPLICAWTDGWANNRDVGYLRRHGAHYDVTVTTNTSAYFLECIVRSDTEFESSLLSCVIECLHYGIRCWSPLAIEWTLFWILNPLYSFIRVGVSGPPLSSYWSSGVLQAISSVMYFRNFSEIYCNYQE